MASTLGGWPAGCLEDAEDVLLAAAAAGREAAHKWERTMTRQLTLTPSWLGRTLPVCICFQCLSEVRDFEEASGLSLLTSR